MRQIDGLFSGDRKLTVNKGSDLPDAQVKPVKKLFFTRKLETNEMRGLEYYGTGSEMVTSVQDPGEV